MKYINKTIEMTPEESLKWAISEVLKEYASSLKNKTNI